VEDEEGPNPLVEAANSKLAEVRSQLRETEKNLRESESRARTAEERFGAVSDLVKHLFGEDKRQRILFAHKQWPNAESHNFRRQPHVSEVLKGIRLVVEDSTTSPGNPTSEAPPRPA
jgi:hypothetical protein